MSGTPRPDPSYERPCVEQVLTPEDLAREILYAGVDGTPTEDEVEIPPP